MNKKITITEAELVIMKVLWEKGEMTSPELLSYLEGNASTLKTLLKRLVEKGAVGTKEVKARTFRYFPIVTEEEYINFERKGFLNRVFDGSREKLLLNFVKEEKISKDDLLNLISLIEEEL